MCPQSTHWPSQSADLSNNGLVVDEVSEVHGGDPRVILIKDAAAAGLLLLPLGHSQLVPREALGQASKVMNLILRWSTWTSVSHLVYSMARMPPW